MCKTEYVIEVESVMSNGTACWTENTEFSTNNHYSKTPILMDVTASDAGT